MTEIWMNWILLVSVMGIAVISPGPDFVMVVRNSVLYSRKAGLLTAAGLSLSICVHVFYTLAGIATVIAQSVALFSLIKYAGAAYLFYIGLKALKSRGFKGDADYNIVKKDTYMTGFQALRSGFLTNLLNPKASLFFLAIFTQFVGPGTALSVQVFYGLTCAVIIWLWFSVVALVLTNVHIKSVFLKASCWIDRVCGVLMIGLGIRLALTKGSISP